ncbi:MAG: hypothetical protein LBT62_04915 [Deltaproteobacteria bacterium]|nr:hypothetical protein [Deltaproteobacteria bacterium]
MKDAIAYLMPDLASDMVASKKIMDFYVKKRPEENFDSDFNMRISDIFMSVPVKGGEMSCLACLAWQQHENDKDFSRHVFDSYVLLRDSSSAGKATVFVIYLGNSKNVNNYTEICCGSVATIKFRSFHLLSCDVDQLRRDKNAIARVLYAGRMSHEIGDDLRLREQYAAELLNMADDRSYDRNQGTFILEFSETMFGLKDPNICRELRNAYDRKLESLRDYSKKVGR